MIPKIIHYAWFGPKPMPPGMVAKIEHWRHVLPGYEFRFWNEANFDVSATRFMREAYASGNYAFVVDVVRFSVLYKYGGIYLDTDVEVLRPFDRYLGDDGFLGYETDAIGSGVIGAVAGTPWLRDCVGYYERRHFINIAGKTVRTTSPRVLTAMVAPYIGSSVKVYAIDRFCAKDWRTGEVRVTDDTVCIHHYADSWHGKRLSLWGRIAKLGRGIVTRCRCRSVSSFMSLPVAAKCRHFRYLSAPSGQ